MAMVKKSISVTDQQDRWIKAQIQSGHFGNESEVVRELIRERQIREQEMQTEIEAIRCALIEGERLRNWHSSWGAVANPSVSACASTPRISSRPVTISPPTRQFEKHFRTSKVSSDSTGLPRFT